MALMSAAIFAVFPGHLEAVQWLSCYFDIFCTLFFLSSLLSLLSFLKTRKIIFYVASLLFALLSILSKEAAIILPLVSLILATIYLGRKKIGLGHLLESLRYSLPYFALFTGYMIVRTELFQALGVYTPSIGSFLNAGMLSKYGRIFENLIIPLYKTDINLRVYQSAILIFLGLLSLSFLIRRESRKAIVFGLLWIIITALPILGVLEDVCPFRRFNYLPSIGFCLIAGQLPQIFSGLNTRIKVILPASLVLFGIYYIITYKHNALWKEAWNVSKEVQRDFQDNVAPTLRKPAKAYFYNVPEGSREIHVFFTGFSDCMDMLSKEKANQYYIAHKDLGPHIASPINMVMEEHSSNYYLFEWNSSSNKFQEIDPMWQDFTGSDPRAKVHSYWDFSNYVHFFKWEAANDLRIIFVPETRSRQLFTVGQFSLLKSPQIDGRIKYFQITYRASSSKGMPLSGKLLWVTNSDRLFDEKKSISFPVINDGSLHTYTIPLYLNGWSMREPILRFGLRLSKQTETIIYVESIRLFRY